MIKIITNLIKKLENEHIISATTTKKSEELICTMTEINESGRPIKRLEKITVTIKIKYIKEVDLS